MLGLTIGRVQGTSMVPRIPPDSFFIAINWYKFLPKLFPMRVGDVYYIKHSRYGLIIKTLHAIDTKNNCYWFRGESPHSTSTEAMGAVPSDAIIGRVIWVISPKR